eukprot:ctg_660.g349
MNQRVPGAWRASYGDTLRSRSQASRLANSAETGSTWRTGASAALASPGVATRGRPASYGTILPPPPPPVQVPFVVPEVDAATLAKRDYVNVELAKRSAEYTQVRDLRFYVATFNVNARPPVVDLTPLLRDHASPGPSPPLDWRDATAAPATSRESAAQTIQQSVSSASMDAGDVAVFGFQEVQRLSGTAAVITDENQGRPWRVLIESLLATSGKYVCVMHKQLVGIMLLVFVRAEHANAVRNLQVLTVGTGIAGLGGNKGGIAARFRLYDTSVCCVCCHLTAHEHNVEKRNADYRAILDKALFENVPGESNTLLPPAAAPASPYSAPDALPPSMSVLDHDVVFLFGDLNYRIALRPEEVMRGIAAADWAYLASFDQLNTCRQAGFAFEPFTEAPLHFAPTYKYKPYEDEYEMDSDNPGALKRTPAWCDRVLYRGQNVRVRSYRRHEVFFSDHRPVSCMLSVPVRQVDRDRRQAVLDRLWRDVNRRENELLPRLAVSDNDLFLGTVRFRVPQQAEFTIRNVGRVPTRWYLPSQHLRRWMRCVPREGHLQPHQQVRVRIEVFVDEYCGYSAAFSEAPRMESVLVVQAEDGAAVFVSLHGRYQRSVYGSLLESLAGRNGGRGIVVPELWLMGDALLRRRWLGTVSGLFVEPCADAAAVEAVREALDTGVLSDAARALEHAPPLAVADVLVNFLRYLEVPVVPPASYETCVAAAAVGDRAAVLQELARAPPAHRNTFVYVVSMVREHLALLRGSLDLAEALARVFGPALLRSNHGGSDHLTERARFFRLFLDAPEADLGGSAAADAPTQPSAAPLYELLFDVQGT